MKRITITILVVAMWAATSAQAQTTPTRMDRDAAVDLIEMMVHKTNPDVKFVRHTKLTGTLNAKIDLTKQSFGESLDQALQPDSAWYVDDNDEKTVHIVTKAEADNRIAAGGARGVATLPSPRTATAASEPEQSPIIRQASARQPIARNVAQSVQQLSDVERLCAIRTCYVNDGRSSGIINYRPPIYGSGPRRYDIGRNSYVTGYPGSYGSPWYYGSYIGQLEDLRKFGIEDIAGSFKIESPLSKERLEAIDVFVDGEFQDHASNINNFYEGTVPLTAGSHRIEIIDNSETGGGFCYNMTVAPAAANKALRGERPNIRIDNTRLKQDFKPGVSPCIGPAAGVARPRFINEIPAQ